MDTRSARFPLVDSLRALAALAIVLFHVQGYAGALQVPVLRDLAARLPVGVTLFFLVSGFLLYRPFVRARLRGEALPAVGAYAWRRVLRIVPAYWVALTVLGLLVKPEVFSGGSTFLFYSFTQVYAPAQALNGLAVAWSLNVEVSFYALLPLYALALRALPGATPVARLRWELGGLAALVLAGVATRVWALEGGLRELGAALLTLPVFLNWFALGMGLAVLSAWCETRPLPRAVRWIDRRPGLSWLAAAALFALAAIATAQLAQDGKPANLAVNVVLYPGVALFLLAPAVLGHRGGGAVRRLLAWRPLAWLGLVSYGIFLWHGIVIALVGKWTALGPPSFLAPNLLWLVVVPPIAIVIAALSYYLVERPALSFRRLVPARRGTPDPPGAVSVPAAPPAS